MSPRLAVTCALAALAFSGAQVARAQAPENRNGNLDLTMTLLPEHATGPEEITRRIELPRPPGAEERGSRTDADGSGDEGKSSKPDASERGRETSAEARERGREFGQEAAEQAREHRENAGRGPDDNPGAGSGNGPPESPPDRPETPGKPNDLPTPPATPAPR